jgi:hypothetical protein
LVIIGLNRRIGRCNGSLAHAVPADAADAGMGKVFATASSRCSVALWIEPAGEAIKKGLPPVSSRTVKAKQMGGVQMTRRRRLRMLKQGTKQHQRRYLASPLAQLGKRGAKRPLPDFSPRCLIIGRRPRRTVNVSFSGKRCLATGSTPDMDSQLLRKTPTEARHTCAAFNPSPYRCSNAESSHSPHLNSFGDRALTLQSGKALKEKRFELGQLG